MTVVSRANLCHDRLAPCATKGTCRHRCPLFEDLDDYLRSRGASVSPCHPTGRGWSPIIELNDKRTAFVSASGSSIRRGRPGASPHPWRKGESSPMFTADGDLLFVAARPTEEDDKRLRRCGDCLQQAVKRSRRWRCRVASSRSHRAWAACNRGCRSSCLGCGSTRTTDCDAAQGQQGVGRAAHPATRSATGTMTLVLDTASLLDLDVTNPRTSPPARGCAVGPDFDVSPDGRFVVTGWHGPRRPRVHPRSWSASTRSGEHGDRRRPRRRPVEPGHLAGRFAVAYIRESYSTPDKAPRITLCY